MEWNDSIDEGIYGKIHVQLLIRRHRYVFELTTDALSSFYPAYGSLLAEITVSSIRHRWKGSSFSLEG